MLNSIIAGLDKPAELERLYRSNKIEFKQNFKSVYCDYAEKPIVQFWHERLNYEAHEISWGTALELKFVVIASVLAGVLAKLPDIFGIQEDFFYPRNISFLTFGSLIFFYAWKNAISKRKILFIGITALASLIYINLLPSDLQSDTLTMACIHLPLILWILLGLSFTGKAFVSSRKRLEFISFNGELLVMSAMLVLAGIILTGITIGLFELIGLQIVDFYFRYLVVFALPSIPIIANFLVKSNPNLVNKVSPVIAQIFSPLVLAMLLVYLVAMIYSGKDPYTDRDFLIIFNVLLIGVMALIFFSVTESWKEDRLGLNRYILFALAIVTIAVNAIALSAIIFRISEWGFTSNRLTVLGGNLLILIHLLLVTFKLFNIARTKTGIQKVGKSIVRYLPVYFVWFLIVVFLFPLIFGFK